MKKVFNIEPESRVFIVGDLHGEHGKLMERLNEVNFDEETDHLFSVGDLIDRGEQNVECLNLISEPWFHSVRGNHEDMMIKAIIENDQSMAQCWFANGGNWYWALDPEEKIYVNDRAIEASNLPYWIEINYKGKKTIVCHADWPSNDYIENPDLHEMIWSRDRINKLMKYQESNPIEGADLFVFGHTPLRRPLRDNNCMWIDTGAVFGKELTVIEL